MAVNMAIFIDKAVPIEHKNKMAIAPLYADRLPKVLAMGAHIKLDDPMANNTPALVTLICSDVVSNSAAISGVAGYRHVLENVVARHIKLTVKRITDLCQVGKSVPFLNVSLAIGGAAVEDPMMYQLLRCLIEASVSWIYGGSRTSKQCAAGSSGCRIENIDRDSRVRGIIYVNTRGLRESSAAKRLRCRTIEENDFYQDQRLRTCSPRGRPARQCRLRRVAIYPSTRQVKILT